LRQDEWKDVRWIPADITSDDAVRRLLEAARPDLIIHLAGISFVPDAEGAPVEAYDVNVLGAVRLLSSVVSQRRRSETDPVVVIVGSGMQYGAHPADAMPLDENVPQRPLGAYGASKASQEIAALQIARTSGLRVVCTRSFSHSGVGHASSFLIPSLVARIRALRESGDPLEIGNDVIRDYLHVTDAVSAYLALADRGRAGEAYNVSSGLGIGVRQLATLIVERAGLKTEIVSVPHLQRQSDIPILIGSNRKLARETGWQPTKTVVDIIDDFLKTL
jgi:GDP-4-dehydro-6-deoxy-D-mannose reductase